jgi:hypothetical protein
MRYNKDNESSQISSEISDSAFDAIEEEPVVPKKVPRKFAMSILNEPYSQSLSLNKYATGRKHALIKEHETSSSP